MTISSEAIEAALLKVAGIHHIHGIQCLCGFKSFVSRDRTKHIMDAALDAAAPFIRAAALEEAADDYRHYETPNARLYLRERAAVVRGDK